MRRSALFLAVLLVMPTAALAAKDVDDLTVQDFRAELDKNYQIGVASGAFTALSIIIDCPVVVSVGELWAYLMYSAQPTDKLYDAMWAFYFNHRCTVRKIITPTKDEVQS